MIRFGIVGAKGIAKKFARDILLAGNAKITAVSARDKETAEKYQKEYNVEYAFSSYEDMAKSDAIDAVYIATPHNFHYEQALLFLNHKKHVLVEKPIAVNLEQLQEMISAAEKNDVILMEAMWTYFLPSTVYINNLIKANMFGKLLEAKIEFGYSLINNYPDSGRLLNPMLAGGSLLDLGVYVIDFYNLIHQENIKSLEASAQFTHTLVDESCEIKIVDQNEAIITLRSNMAKQYKNEAHLKFEKANIVMKDFSRCKHFIINDQDYHLDYEGEGFVHEISSFSESIIKNEKMNSIMNYDIMKKNLKLIDEIREKINLKYPFEIKV
jgi:predicted dehydrogenase